MKTVANYAIYRCNILSLKIRACKKLDKYHVWLGGVGCDADSDNLAIMVLERSVWGLTKEKPFICHNDYRTVGNSGDVDDEVCGGLIAEQASKSISKGRQ